MPQPQYKIQISSFLRLSFSHLKKACFFVQNADFFLVNVYITFIASIDIFPIKKKFFNGNVFSY